MSRQEIEIMVHKCDKQIDYFRSTIEYYQKIPVLSSSLSFYKQRWAITLAIKQRLENYHQKL